MKSKLIIILAAFIFTVTVILLFYLHSTNEKEVVRRFQAEQLVASRQVARGIESYLGDRTRGVEVLSSFSILQYRDLNKITATIQEYFEYVKKDHVKAISVYDEKGTIIYSTSENTIGRSCGQLDFFQWATKRENKGKQFISSLIQKTDDTTAAPPNFRFLIAAPIYNDAKDPQYPKPTHKFVGVVTATIDLEELLAEFLPLVSPFAGKEHVWILDSNGNVLFQSAHPEMVMKSIYQPDETCMQCHISFEHFGTILSERQGRTEYKLKEGPKKLASFSSVEIKNISWKVVLNLPEEEVSGFINKNLILTFILIGVITLTLIGGSALIYRSNRLKIRAQEEAKQWMEKRELEDKIRESEEHYRTVVDISPDAIIIHCEGKIVFVNQAAVKLVGASSAGDLIGKPAIEFVHPDERESVGKRILEILKSGKSSTWLEERFIIIDGSIIYVETVGTPITYNGKPSVQVIIHDITERKRAEEAVRQSELQFRLVWEKSADGMRLIDVQGTVVMVNEAFCRMVEKPREAMVGKPLSVIYTEEQQAHILRTHQERFRARIIIPHLERELTLWNGKKVWFELSNSFFELEGHRPLLLSIFRDITEQKRAEEELHRKEEHHKAVIENIFKFVPEGVLVLTESLNLLKHNKAFDNIVQKYAPLLGYTEEELAEKITEQLRSKIATGDAAEIRITKKNQ